MEKKVKEMGFTKLNNAEHLSFHIEASLFVEKCSAEKISAQEEFLLYQAEIEKEVEILNRQTASPLTKDLDAKDRERDELLSYLFATINNAKNAPMANFKEAYKQLVVVITPYQGISQKAHAQETAEIFSLLSELRKQTNLQHIQSLSLTSVLDLIEAKNNEYIAIDQRRTSEIPTKKDTNELRAKIDKIYTSVIDKANATAILAPNDDALTFINNMNNLIDKTNASYNIRTATRTTEDSTKEEETESNADTE